MVCFLNSLNKRTIGIIAIVVRDWANSIQKREIIIIANPNNPIFFWVKNNQEKQITDNALAVFAPIMPFPILTPRNDFEAE